MGQRRDRWASSSDEDDHDDSKTKQQPSKKNKVAAAQPQQQYSSSLSSSFSNLPLHNPLTQGCRSVYDTYDQVARVSEGTYGIVWKATNRVTHETVALKQIKFDINGVVVDETSTGVTTTQQPPNQQGFSIAALREINVLLALNHHDAIVSVQEMVVGSKWNQVFMVMEWYEFDLKVGLERFDGALLQAELKGILQQVLSGMEHVHRAWYLHRDMKTSNILVHRTGRIALADFGLARPYSEPRRPLTQLVCTLWYRAPELLLGHDRYGPPVDVWSIGCIFAELLRKEALFQGQGELDQMDQIFATVGTPTTDVWPEYESLPNAGLLRWKSRRATDLLLPQKFPINAPTSAPNQAFLDAHGYHLLERLLTLDPKQRITATEALQHPYLCNGVQPKVPRFFSTSS